MHYIYYSIYIYSILYIVIFIYMYIYTEYSPYNGYIRIVVKLFDVSWTFLHLEVGPVKGQDCDHRQVPFPGFFAPALENEMRELGPVAGVLKGGVPGSVRPWTKDGGETWGSYKSPEMGIWSRGYPEIGWNWMKLAHRTVKYWMVTIVKGCDMWHDVNADYRHRSVKGSSFAN